LRKRSGRFSRNLRANEIVDQIIAVERASGDKMTIRFMGMGEPLAQLRQLASRNSDHQRAWGLGIARPHHALNQRTRAANSKLADEPLQVRLAVSLHGANDEVRDQIMPINRRYNGRNAAGRLRLLTSRRRSSA